ncbi:MAG: hypothetical protein EXR72_11145 [Myxococcales bacterium]|nr:hypothetical protein [Myxococcales bacterium]
MRPLVTALVLLGLVVAGCRSKAKAPRPAAPSQVAKPPPATATPTPVVLAPPIPDKRPRGTWLALVYTGNGQGEVEPCG